MKRLFGGGKPAVKGPTLTEATQKVDARADTMDQKIRKLDAQLVQCREQLKKLKPGPAQNGLKQKALRILKQKKMYEQQREQLMNQSFNMNQAEFASQSMQDTVTTVSAMKTANVEMKKQFKKVSLDEIENIQDDMSELIDYSNEINETLGRNYATPDVDESELEDELAALGEELELEGEASYLDIPNLPEAETATPSASAQPIPQKLT